MPNSLGQVSSDSRTNSRDPETFAKRDVPMEKFAISLEFFEKVFV